jgi:hypothetical protein
MTLSPRGTIIEAGKGDKAQLLLEFDEDELPDELWKLIGSEVTVLLAQTVLMEARAIDEVEP